MITKRGLLAAGAVLAISSASSMAQTKTVVVYTAHHSFIVDTMVPIFEKETGIKVEVVKAGSGDILRRVKAEARTPRADVIWSVGAESLDDNKDILAAYTPKGYEAVDARFKVSPEWQPYTAYLNVVIANTQQVPEAQRPKSWADLSDPKWKGKVVSAKAESSGSAFAQYATILYAFGDKGFDAYQKLFNNFQLIDSSGAVPRFVNDGEAPFGITLEDSALEYVKGGGKIAIIYPSEGVSMLPDGIALVKGGPNAESGKAFIDWALSKSTQEALVEKIGRRSVRTDVAGPSALPSISAIKLVGYDVANAARNQKDWIAKWREMQRAR